MNKFVLILAGVIVIIAVAYFTQTSKAPVPSSGQTTRNTEVLPTAEKQIQPSTSTSLENVEKGSYEAYAPEKIARAQNGKVVLFFHASWCPTCRALSSSIEKGNAAIPANVSILKTDYDTETQLKQKYAVTYQHTLVQVDEAGNMLKKWSGSSSLEKLLGEIQ